MKRSALLIIIVWFLILISACQETWLDAKPDKKLVVPSTLVDLQALLDFTRVMNDRVMSSLGVLSSDDLYLGYDDWQNLSNQSERKVYIWAKDLAYDEEGIIDWNWPYRQVYYANIALEGLAQIIPETQEQDAWNNIKGSALFYRSWAFYQLAQLFCKPYRVETASQDAGIPLKLESDINKKVSRATIEDTYQQIILDLKTSIPFLPVDPLVKTRPSKPAAYSLLARTYLQMGNYRQALLYADSCLRLHNQLIDYNEIDSLLDYPFARYNDEVIFHLSIDSRSSFSASRMRVDTLLFREYSENDIRKNVFFAETADSTGMNFRGSYDGSRYFFGGIATDEPLLIRAECYARTGDTNNALKDLNTLLAHRFKKGSFDPITVELMPELLEIILGERRKELLFRGIRWSDLRRLNQDQRFEKTLIRWPEGEPYRLEPGSPRYTFSIPQQVIDWNNMEQNQR